jgi:hypothetical protein
MTFDSTLDEPDDGRPYTSSFPLTQSPLDENLLTAGGLTRPLENEGITSWSYLIVT